MTRAITWKALTIGAALSGLSIFGAGAAAAITPPAPAGPVIAASVNADAPAVTGTSDLRPDRSANSSKTRTSGSTSIYTAPNPGTGPSGATSGLYGPFFNQNRGLGGAAGIGAAAGGR